jgi:uncharacterized protein involved in type VI secretion and phage assembly
MIDRQRYYGKYRGRVVNNIDPKNLGRVQAVVPDVLGPTLSPWALPALLSVGAQSGTFVVPPVGAGVWIEFEQGDLDYPIWAGGFWDCAADVPVQARASAPGFQNFVVETPGKNTLQLIDGPAGGTIMLKTAGGASITTSDAGGIMISDGQGGTIVITKGVVSINGTALVVK